MNPLNTIEKAKIWADNRAKIYQGKQCFVVCKYNDGFIVQGLKFLIDHINEYTMDSIVYCTDEIKFESFMTDYFMKS